MAQHARGTGDVDLAMQSIAVAALANTVAKTGLVAILGSPGLRTRILIAAAAIVATGLLSIALV